MVAQDLTKRNHADGENDWAKHRTLWDTMVYWIHLWRQSVSWTDMSGTRREEMRWVWGGWKDGWGGCNGRRCRRLQRDPAESGYWCGLNQHYEEIISDLDQGGLCAVVCSVTRNGSISNWERNSNGLGVKGQQELSALLASSRWSACWWCTGAWQVHCRQIFPEKIVKDCG